MKLTPDDDRISAYLDGELSPEERAAFEAELATSPEVRRLVDELGGLKRRVNELPTVGVKVNLAPEILKRIEAQRSGTPVAASASQSPTSQTASEKIHFGNVNQSKSTSSWYGRSRRAMAMLIGSLAVVVVAVGTTMWWQVQHEQNLGDANESYFGVALNSEQAPDVSTHLEMASAPMADVMMSRTDLQQQLDVDPAALLAQVPQLNSRNKWATIMPAPEGPVVESQMQSDQVVNNIYIQNTNPTSELIPVEVYCDSVPATVRGLERSLARNGIALQNNFSESMLAASEQDSVSGQYKSRQYKTSIPEEPTEAADANVDGVSTMMSGSPAMAPAPEMTSPARMNELVETEPEQLSDVSITQRENGDVAVYVDAPASQVLRFLADAEQQQDVSKLMFNNIEPVQVTTFAATTSPAAATDFANPDAAMTNFHMAGTPPVDIPAAQPQNTRMMKSNVLPKQAYEAESTTSAAGQVLENKAESFAGIAGSSPAGAMMDSQADSPQMQVGQATWMELPRPSAAVRDNRSIGLERRQVQAPLQIAMPITATPENQPASTPWSDRENLTRGVPSLPDNLSLSESVTSNGREVPGAQARGGYSPKMQDDVRYGTVLSEAAGSSTPVNAAEPRWRVLLILKPQSTSNPNVPPPPAMPEQAD
ncbi:anti-sigma factor family protein [Lacunimicrobium album]